MGDRPQIAGLTATYTLPRLPPPVNRKIISHPFKPFSQAI